MKTEKYVDEIESRWALNTYRLGWKQNTLKHLPRKERRRLAQSIKNASGFRTGKEIR